jgi:hypothetical protein
MFFLTCSTLPPMQQCENWCWVCGWLPQRFIASGLAQSLRWHHLLIGDNVLLPIGHKILSQKIHESTYKMVGLFNWISIPIIGGITFQLALTLSYFQMVSTHKVSSYKPSLWWCLTKHVSFPWQRKLRSFIWHMTSYSLVGHRLQWLKLSNCYCRILQNG